MSCQDLNTAFIILHVALKNHRVLGRELNESYRVNVIERTMNQIKERGYTGVAVDEFYRLLVHLCKKIERNGGYVPT